jgi:polysaccharide pyruvyl transferase WcaK-like protein
VFLPQAFGPFAKSEIASWSRRLLEDATVIFARDGISAEYVRTLCPNAQVKQCVDFTLGLQGVDPGVMQEDYGVIVPNSKMYTHSKMSRSEYIDLNVQCARALHSAGLRPVVMAHESTDLELAREIATLSASRSFWDPSPLVLKGMVKGAALTVGSRYHALVGSLSSSKPTVALGWSHKYEELFSDFGVEDWVARDARSVPGMIEEVLGDLEGQARLKAALSLRMKEVHSMWSDVARAVVADDRKGL